MTPIPRPAYLPVHKKDIKIDGENDKELNRIGAKIKSKGATEAENGTFPFRT